MSPQCFLLDLLFFGRRWEGGVVMFFFVKKIRIRLLRLASYFSTLSFALFKDSGSHAASRYCNNLN